MRQFEVARLRGQSVYSLGLNIQSDVHSRLTTRLIVPMVIRSRYDQPITGMTPVLRVQEKDYVLMFPLMASVPISALGEIVGTLAAHRPTLLLALDLLVTGA